MTAPRRPRIVTVSPSRGEAVECMSPHGFVSVTLDASGTWLVIRHVVGVSAAAVSSAVSSTVVWTTPSRDEARDYARRAARAFGPCPASPEQSGHRFSKYLTPAVCLRCGVEPLLS